MMNKTIMSELFKHMEWADAKIWTAIMSSADAINDNKILSYSSHLHMVQQMFLNVWKDKSMSLEAMRNQDNSAAQILGRAQVYYKEVQEYITGLSDEQFSDPATPPFIAMVEQILGRKPEPTNKGETALQVALHTMHHRAQISAKLRELEVEPPTVDYIAWLRNTSIFDCIGTFEIIFIRAEARASLI